MTAKEMIDVMLKLPAECLITSDSGWECSETDICEVWYSATENEARLTQRNFSYRDNTLGFCLMWREEDDDSDGVVRCKDCKHRNGDYCHNYGGNTYGQFVRMTDFCTCGVRMDGEQDA